MSAETYKLILLTCTTLGVLILLGRQGRDRLLLQTLFKNVFKDLTFINRRLEYIMTTVAELPAALDTFGAQLTEGIGEITAEIQTLRDALANQNLSPDAQASLDRLGVLAAKVANISPPVVTE